MAEQIPSDAQQRRHLLPRWPSDAVVWGLLAAGVAVALVARVDVVYGLLPGAVAGWVQHISGHVRAWRMGGVERAFVMESSAISFYVVVVGLVVAAVLQLSGLLEIEIHWLAIGALFVDTISRSVRERRFAQVRNRLAELRADKGWTQAELAERLGVSRQTVISIERERFDPSLPLAFQISSLFGLAIEQVFDPD